MYQCLPLMLAPGSACFPIPNSLSLRWCRMYMSFILLMLMLLCHSAFWPISAARSGARLVGLQTTIFPSATWLFTSSNNLVHFSSSH